MTLEALVHDAGQRWTVDDLSAIPDDGMRYEIFDGSLLVSPMPKNIHAFVTQELADRLRDQAPAGIRVTCFGIGLNVRGNRS